MAIKHTRYVYNKPIMVEYCCTDVKYKWSAERCSIPVVLTGQYRLACVDMDKRIRKQKERVDVRENGW